MKNGRVLRKGLCRNLLRTGDYSSLTGENLTFYIVKPPKSGDFGGNSGCGGRTRTYDLRVMRRLEPVLTVLNPLKCGELVQVFTVFYG